MQEMAASPRPRNPWRAIALLVLAIFAGLVLVAACMAAIVGGTPKRTLKVPRADLQTGVPAFYPLPSLGADRAGRTHGVWVVLRADGQAQAFFSRDSHSGCTVPWRADFVFEGRAGWFRDPCTGSTYTLEGEKVFGPAPRGLDRHPASVEEAQVVVDLEQVLLGTCQYAGETLCSPPGQPVYRDEAPPPLVQPEMLTPTRSPASS